MAIEPKRECAIEKSCGRLSLVAGSTKRELHEPRRDFR
jgi:hypothetical protein